MKRYTKWIAVLAVTAILGAMVVKLMKNKAIVDSRKDVNTEEARVAVTVAAVEKKNWSRTLELVGTTSADKEVLVPAELAGKLVAVNFKQGDYVKKGSLLAKLEDTYKQLAYENAKLSYSRFKKDYERFQALYAGDAVSDIQLSDMKAGYDNAEIQLRTAEKQLADTRITAPFDGYITQKNTEQGAWVNAGAPIATIVNIAQLRVLMAVAEHDAYRLRKGQEVQVLTSVYPNEVFKGTITSISPQGSSSHTYPVEVRISNDKQLLKAGTYVNVVVQQQSRTSLLIPRDAIVSSVKDPSVFVVRDAVAKLVKISIGQTYDSFLEVVAGLDEGDQVVVNGQINLTDGAKVVISKQL